MTTFIPSKSLKLHSTDPVWWTPECTEATKRKRNAWKRLRLHPADAHLQLAYTQATATASACLQRAEDTHATAICRRLAAGGLSSREWWSTVKRAGGCGRSHDIPTLKEENGAELTTSKDKAESFARYFSAKCSLGDDLDASNLPYVRPRSDACLSTIPCRPRKVCRELRKIVPSKATGSDGVPGRVLKQCCEELCRPVWPSSSATHSAKAGNLHCRSLPRFYLCTRRVRRPQQRTTDPYPCCQYCQRSWKLPSIVALWDSLSTGTS